MPSLIFLKLGGSLITDKSHHRTPRMDVLRRISEEIASARSMDPGLSLVIGHGSGSYGHVPARKYGTRTGVSTREQWIGFAEVWRDARLLNQIVIESLVAAGVPVLAFPPSASVVSAGGQVLAWELDPIMLALDASLVPVLNGDVVFDTRLGGTILSTEDVFIHLARHLRPQRILLAGIEPGVWANYPARTHLIPSISTSTLSEVTTALQGSSEVDVTGGMAQKVCSMVSLAQELPGLETLIFSGMEPGSIRQAMAGSYSGTTITM
jgi:isopentenyl phosphate kinase